MITAVEAEEILPATSTDLAIKVFVHSINETSIPNVPFDNHVVINVAPL
jgi:hypothetical protein